MRMLYCEPLGAYGWAISYSRGNVFPQEGGRCIIRPLLLGKSRWLDKTHAIKMRHQ